MPQVFPPETSPMRPGDPRYQIVGATDGFAITPNDSTDLVKLPRGLIVGTAGAVRVTMLSGAVLTLPLLAAGVIHSLQVTRVHSTGTTATGIFGLL